MPAYEHAGFKPPAPVARAVVGAPDGSVEVQDVAMLLDTGADVSVIPRAVADRLGITARLSGVRLQGYGGAQTEAAVADPRLDVLRYRFRGTFVVSTVEHGVLGRDVLNLLTVTLDGPPVTWSA